MAELTSPARRATLSFMAYTTATLVWGAVALSPLLAEDDEEVEQTDRILPPADPIPHTRTKEGDKDEDDSLFIPLGWPRRVYGGYYHPDDPEWKTFLQYSRDDKLLRRIGEELTVLTHAHTTRQIGHALGTPVEICHASMRMRFPHQAPPEYVQRGLEIRDDSILWTTRSIPAKQGDQIRSHFQPYSAAWSIFGASWFLIERKLRYIQSIFTQDTSQLDTGIKKQEFRPGSGLQLRNSNGIVGAPQPDKTRYQTPASLNTSGSGREEYPGQTQSTDKKDKDKSKIERLIGSPDPDALAAYAAFKTLMEIGLKSEGGTPPRGVFFCNGLVELRASKGDCEVYARGIYDPATKTWFAVKYELMSFRPYTFTRT